MSLRAVTVAKVLVVVAQMRAFSSGLAPNCTTTGLVDVDHTVPNS